eukprot:5910508-Amphidinium_carterae.1
MAVGEFEQITARGAASMTGTLLGMHDLAPFSRPKERRSRNWKKRTMRWCLNQPKTKTIKSKAGEVPQKGKAAS